MAFSIYDTITMLGAYKTMASATTFIRDRYFLTSESDMFSTPKVLVEYGTESRRLAPVVMPRVGGVAVEREGYESLAYTPPTVAPKRVLTVDDLQQKQFGEALFGNKTPAEREGLILGNDLREMDAQISSTEEYMAAQALQNNGYVLKQYADEYGTGKFKEFEIRFYKLIFHTVITLI